MNTTDLQQIDKLLTKRFDEFEEKVDGKFDVFGKQVDDKFSDFGKLVDQKFDKFGKEVDKKLDALKEDLETEIGESARQIINTVEALKADRHQVDNLEKRVDVLERLVS